MELYLDINGYIIIFSVVVGLIGSYFILKIDWKRYGLLYLLSATVGIILCYIFMKVGFYSYPYKLVPFIDGMVITLTFIPFAVIFAVRFSPSIWAWKIPFYWVIIHLLMVGETIGVLYTDIIKYHFKWDFWTSYTWWWIYFLIFEWIGGIFIPDHLRKPFNHELFRYGKIGFAIFHFIIIVTIFLGGYYLGYLVGT